MAGTAGNLSARADGGGFWITASGLPKGQLDERDFLQVCGADGVVLQRFSATARPSAETAIHAVIYELFPEARACFHVHSVDACVAAERAAAETEMTLPAMEMIKGLGVWDEAPQVALPLFPNWADIRRIADEIHGRFSRRPPPVPALMIRGHGVTVWGPSLQDSYNRLEVVEFLMSCARALQDDTA
ncbi:MAG TPA: methylthioribulose 1-phosphate dehydratase [Aliiroseovarius sp.]|nr:methylthioribulose 1-phosphate dehydratase [Aliiroseovarius sp.]